MAGIDIISDTTGQGIIAAIQDVCNVLAHKSGNTVYGFHIKSAEAGPYERVTYLADAVDMIPCKMDYANGMFDWGSWRNAFFMPRPCMLRSNGIVDYYLDPNDYTLKADGTASDVVNTEYDGNAMMEWGQNGKKIWYKIVADEGDITSYSVYIADHKEDDSYRCWSFFDKDNNLRDHFYTPIYQGSLIDGKLRSLSGQTPTENNSGTKEVEYAKANGERWNIEVWSDKFLMFMLLYLIGKSTNVQEVFGQGHSTGGVNGTPADTTGALDKMGMFYGYTDTAKKVKVFGMEDQWGERWNRTLGLMLNNGEYCVKYTEGTADGTTVQGYSTTDTTGMCDEHMTDDADGYVTQMSVAGDCVLPTKEGGSSSTYYCDYHYRNATGVRLALLGGASNNNANCGFYVNLNNTGTGANWNIGTAISYPVSDNDPYIPYLLVKINS